MTSYYIPIVAVTTIILAASLLDLTLLGLEEGVDPASRGLLRLRREATGDEARRDAVTEGVGKGPLGKPGSSTRRRRQAGGTPWPPRGLSCAAVNASTIEVSWSAPNPADVRGIVLGYRVLYGPSQDFHEESCTFLLVSPSTAVYLEGLTNDTHYEIQVMAYTNAAVGSASPPVVCHTPPLIPAAPSSTSATNSA
ncbi:cell adhesion molecule Dscam1-like [Penaeus vannamei]|uniref:cell adhesion molecule Dscam1-like n=1 Tax=Penaeus vannamei TaxID=6689 RepID=UPI00387F7DE6